MQMINKRFDTIFDRYVSVNEECKQIIEVLKNNKKVLTDMTPKELSNGLAVLSMPFRREDDNLEATLVKAFGKEMGLKINDLIHEDISFPQMIAPMTHQMSPIAYRPY